MVPSEYGVVKPWNFICLCKNKKKSASIENHIDEEYEKLEKEFEELLK